MAQARQGIVLAQERQDRAIVPPLCGGDERRLHAGHAPLDRKPVLFQYAAKQLSRLELLKSQFWIGVDRIRNLDHCIPPGLYLGDNALFQSFDGLHVCLRLPTLLLLLCFKGCLDLEDVHRNRQQIHRRHGQNLGSLDHPLVPGR